MGAPASVYDFPMTALDGTPFDWQRARGKVLLIVNTASACGFTPQYRALQALQDEFGARGLLVLGFPCNQFGAQEPGDAAKISEFCERNYGVTFPLFQKIKVNGGQAAPLYAWIKAQAPGLFGSRVIKWNFTKFLIGRDGQVRSRHAPQKPPQALRGEIEKLLEQ